jgi:hypothetical protein
MKNKTLSQNILTLTVAMLFVGMSTLSSLAAAKEINFSSARVNFWVPNEWNLERDGESFVLVEPNEELMIIVVVLEADAVEDALSRLDDEIGQIVDDVTQSSAPREVDHNGMPSLVLDGTGSVDGEAVDLGIMIIETPANKALLAFAIAQSSEASNHADMIERIFNSITGSR